VFQSHPAGAGLGVPVRASLDRVILLLDEAAGLAFTVQVKSTSRKESSSSVRDWINPPRQDVARHAVAQWRQAGMPVLPTAGAFNWRTLIGTLCFPWDKLTGIHAVKEALEARRPIERIAIAKGRQDNAG